VQEHYLTQAWEKAGLATQGGAYLYSRPGAVALPQTLIAQAKAQAFSQQQPTVVALDGGDSPDQALVAPVVLGGHPVGALQLHRLGGEMAQQSWTDAELTLVQAVLDQVAQTAESLRLFEETRERAAREQAIREITDKLRAAPSLTALLEVASRELGQRLGAPHTVLELGIDSSTELAGPKNGQQ
jgi:GAF domain-containing protein